MDISDKHGSQIYKVLKENQRKILEISGANIKELEVQQKETSTKMIKIAENIGADYRKAAPNIAQSHQKALASHFKLQAAPFLSWCDPVDPPLEEADDCDTSIDLAPNDDESAAKGEVSCDKAENLCQPYLELHHMGPGIPVTGVVKCGIVFRKKGQYINGGYYKIKALVQANGWRLLQTWNSGGCASAIPSSGHLKITVKIGVGQLFDVSWSPEHVLIDTTTGGSMGSVHYNNYVEYGTGLRQGYDANIKVELKIDASVMGGGHCYADLKTSEFFYFKVPVVTMCKFNWPIWHIEGITAESFRELMLKEFARQYTQLP